MTTCPKCKNTEVYGDKRENKCFVCGHTMNKKDNRKKENRYEGINDKRR